MTARAIWLAVFTLGCSSWAVESLWHVNDAGLQQAARQHCEKEKERAAYALQRSYERPIELSREASKDCSVAASDVSAEEALKALAAIPVWIVGCLWLWFATDPNPDSLPDIPEHSVFNNVTTNVRNYFMGDHIVNSRNVISKSPAASMRITEASGNSTLPGWERARVIVEHSANPGAMQDFRDLGNEVAKEQPDKHRVRGLWHGLSEALPAVKDIAELAETVVKLWA